MYGYLGAISRRPTLHTCRQFWSIKSNPFLFLLSADRPKNRLLFFSMICDRFPWLDFTLYHSSRLLRGSAAVHTYVTLNDSHLVVRRNKRLVIFTKNWPRWKLPDYVSSFLHWRLQQDYQSLGNQCLKPPSVDQNSAGKNLGSSSAQSLEFQSMPGKHPPLGYCTWHLPTNSQSQLPVCSLRAHQTSI